MVDELTLGICYDVDRSIQLGYFDILDCVPISKDDGKLTYLFSIEIGVGKQHLLLQSNL